MTIGIYTRPDWFTTNSAFTTDGEHHSKEVSWKEKNRSRTIDCPSIEEWQSRLVDRFTYTDIDSLLPARGRVAQIITYSKILSGDDYVACDIVKAYGKDFPKNTKLTSKSKDIIYNLFKKDFDYFKYEK